MGARIPVSWLHEKSGIPEAGDDEEILKPKPQAPMMGALRQPALAALSAAKATRPATPADAIAARLAREGDPHVAAWLERIEAMLENATSLAEFREMLLSAQAELGEDELAALIGSGLSAAELAGRADLEDASGD